MFTAALLFFKELWIEIHARIGPHNTEKIFNDYLKGRNNKKLRKYSLETYFEPEQIERVKGRIIGEGGKARLNIENLTNALITVYGRTVAIIGEPNQLRLAVDAISSLSSGSMHGPVYSKLESARRREKAEKSQLWEDQNVF